MELFPQLAQQEHCSAEYNEQKKIHFCFVSGRHRTIFFCCSTPGIAPGLLQREGKMLNRHLLTADCDRILRAGFLLSTMGNKDVIQ